MVPIAWRHNVYDCAGVSRVAIASATRLSTARADRLLDRERRIQRQHERILLSILDVALHVNRGRDRRQRARPVVAVGELNGCVQRLVEQRVAQGRTVVGNQLQQRVYAFHGARHGPRGNQRGVA